MNSKQRDVLTEIYERTTRGRVQVRQHLERLNKRKHEAGSTLEQNRIGYIARLEEIVAYQDRAIETVNELLLGVE